MIEELPKEESIGAALHVWSEERGWEPGSGRLAQEIALTLYLDRAELVTMMCSPEKLNHLVVGFLRSEGMIQTLDDIALMRVCDEEQVADVRLMKPREVTTSKRILTSGCGGGVTFDEGDSVAPVASDLRVSPGIVLKMMKAMLQSGGKKSELGGMHLAALSDGDGLLVTARDVGRHNTLDKLWGECMFMGIPTQGTLLLATGRISSEMILKAAKMGVPVAASLNSPTDRTVELARQLNITVAGYARGGRVSVYTHPERLGLAFSSNHNHH